ncbi:MAG: DUF1854 domain-containing protein [Defluviitaleaceae bacterium]|nr:DUF1854 domain-containing protein [Defluviitaleaceae bacterium]
MNELGSIQNVDLGIIDVNKAKFYFSKGGFCALKYGNEDHPHVTLKRALPVGSASEYVSVYDNDNKEIGIIRSLNELSGDNLKIVTEELDKRYFCPFILEIKSVKDKLGYVYTELLLGESRDKAHTKSCALKDVSKNVRPLGNGAVIIFDVDGNRYLVKDIEKLDKASRKRLEPYLF